MPGDLYWLVGVQTVQRGWVFMRVDISFEVDPFLLDILIKLKIQIFTLQLNLMSSHIFIDTYLNMYI